MGNSPDVRVRLSAEGEQSIINAFKKIQTEADKTGRVGAKGLSALSSATSTLGRLLPALTFAGIIAGATALVKKSLETADGFVKLSQKTGVSVETLSAYAHGASLAGIETEALGVALGKLAKLAVNAASGGVEAQQTFQDLGIKFRDQQGNLRPLDDLLGDVAERFSKMADGARKSALAQELFGKSGAQLIPLLNQGRAGLKEITKEAERLGLVVDTKTALAIEAFNDNLTRLRGTVQGFANREMAALLPMLSEFVAKLGLLNLETKEWGLRLESAGFAAIGALEALIPFHGKEARGFLALATDAANEAAQVEAKWNAELSKTLAMLDAISRQPKKPATEPAVTDEGARGKVIDTARKLADAELALKRAELDRELALVKAHGAATAAEEADRFKQGLTGLEQYFADRRAMLEFEAAKEIAILEKEQEEILKRIHVAAFRPLKKGEPEAEREAEVLKLRADLTKVQTETEVRRIALTGQQAQLAGEERDAVRQFNVEQLNAEAQFLNAQGQRFAAARVELEAQIVGLKRLAGETDAAFASRQTALREAGEAPIRFDEIQAEARAVFAEIKSRRVGIEALVTRGVISQLEGQEQIALLERERLPQLEAIATAMRAAAVTDEQIEAARQFGNELKQLRASSDLAGQGMARLKESIAQALTSDLANWFAQGIDDAKSFGDAMRGLALSVVQSLRQIAAQALATFIITKLLGGVLNFSRGGQVPAGGGGSIELAGGGLIYGAGTSTSDSIPARVSTGEYIMPAAKVKMPGNFEILEAMRDARYLSGLELRPIGRVRAYREGGLVDGDVQSGAGRSRLEAQFVLEEGVILKRFSASRQFERIVLRAIENNRKTARAILGH